MIYLDNNSTTKPLHVVCEAVVEGIKNCWGNPSSTHSKGQEAASSVELARTKVADFLGVNIDWITFTSGATEANEVVLRYYLANGYYLITSVVEHPAITGLYQKYSPEMIQYVPIENGTGEWSINSLEKALKFPAGGG